MSSDALPLTRTSRPGGPLVARTKRLVAFLQSLAFWIAIALPLVYLPMIAFGLASDYPFGFVTLLGANAVALALGHPYGQPTE